MPALRTLTIIASTLLLLAGGGAGGYYFANQNDSSAPSATAAVAEAAPQPFQQIGGAFQMQSREDGSGCRIDLDRNSIGCVYADGTTQVTSLGDDADVTTQTFARGKDDELCLESSVGEGDADPKESTEEEHEASTITLVTNSRRVKMWEISVPTDMLEDGSLQYYEKDNQPWKIEMFADGESDPLVLNLKTKETVNKRWSLYGTDKAADTCEAPASRKLLDLNAEYVTSYGFLPNMMAIGAFCLPCMAGIIIAAAKQNNACRRRRLQATQAPQLRGSLEVSNADAWETISRGLRNAAAVAAAATVVKAGVIDGGATAAAIEWS